MERDDRINQLLMEIKHQIEEIKTSEVSEYLTEEEIIVLATEIVTSSIVETVQYASPIGMVDRTRVSFMLDDQYEFPIYWEGESYEPP